MILSKSESIDLMQRISNKEYAALSVLMNVFSHPLLSFAYRYVGSKEAAEEVVQDVFMKIWEKAESWKPEAALSTYLFQVTRNRCIDELRKKSFKNTGELSQDFPDSSVLVSEHMVKREQEAFVKKAVLSLPENQRTALILCYYEGMPQREAAKVMKTSLPALEGLLFRAKKALKSEFVKGGLAQ